MSEAESPDLAETATAGTLLGGRVLYRQLASGYRTGIEPVLLAAAVPARPGERVLEAGTGAGAGLLCLAARVPGLRGTGVEIDPALAAVARANFAANDHAGLTACDADLGAWRADGVFDHAMANPPWHDPAGTASPVAGRRRAKQAACGLLAHWAACLGATLRLRGTLSLVLPAASLAEGCAALVAAGCPQISVLPLWPKAGRAAKLAILRGVRGGRGAGALLSGLVLHEADGRYTLAADAVLRQGGALMEIAGRRAAD